MQQGGTGRISPGLDEVPLREGTSKGCLTLGPWATLKVCEVGHYTLPSLGGFFL